MNDSEQPLDAAKPDPDAMATASEVARLQHLFRHFGSDPDDRFLFDLVTRYREGKAQ